jgi:hypothetical protein
LSITPRYDAQAEPRRDAQWSNLPTTSSTTQARAGSILGEGFIDVWRQMDPDHYDRIGRVATPADSRTGLLVPDLGELFETTPNHGAQGAQIGVYSVR